MELVKTIEEIIESHGAYLYDIVTEQSGDHIIYRILVSKEGGVTLDFCGMLSEILSPLLDTNPPVGGNYFLEVSSPGIERKIKTLRQFELSINDEALVTLKGGDKVQGIIKAVEGSHIILSTDDNECITVDFPTVSRAKTIFEW